MYRFLWTLCWPFFRLFYPYKVIGKKNVDNTPKIMICNHYSNLDIFVLGLGVKRKMRFLGKKELFKGKFVCWFMRKMGVIKIDRQTADIQAIKTCLQALKNNQMLTIFPEGTRNKEGDELQDIKNGACMLAIKAKVEIIPVNILKKAKIFSKNRLMIGKPFSLEEFYLVKLIYAIDF